eukprot:CAMPEP_0194146456 /NCGR_PEP_ID=MMETSP0152-20130528/20607_1 /TAXON_ID=1049557 /ORGANISM="Thalassiothrix antarctica, Strain L6-D1" /LENGTH=321 /DNA_ID=CAMNT_0038846983 /DNA_START=125 /DNA_END=1090 /DNA_ORIENTATION=+
MTASVISSVQGWSSASSIVSNKQTASSTSLSAISRRSILVSSSSSIIAAGIVVGGGTNTIANAAEGVEESFESIAERASKMSKLVEQDNESNDIKKEEAAAARRKIRNVPTQTAYDYELPVAGELVSFGKLIKQNDERSKVKVVLVVNMKQDDPVARKDIPELMALATKYGSEGEFVVVMSPTDQGYFEPDTSSLIRLKLAAEYGYGINPVLALTDKMNMLGSGADPFWRWLEGNCRTPNGLGSVTGNFEKFLLDAQTGLPLRRYPRKYKPYNMRDDIEAVLNDDPLPPAGANYKEEWRMAMSDSGRDTYRFQKGLNVFDQ